VQRSASYGEIQKKRCRLNEKKQTQEKCPNYMVNSLFIELQHGEKYNYLKQDLGSLSL